MKVDMFDKFVDTFYRRNFTRNENYISKSIYTNITENGNAKVVLS